MLLKIVMLYVYKDCMIIDNTYIIWKSIDWNNKKCFSSV